MNTFYLDIETIPGQGAWIYESVSEKVSHPKTLKKKESIDAWYAEKFDDAVEKAIEKTSFDGAMNHIICTSIAMNNDDPRAFYIDDVSEEKDALHSLFEYINENALYGDIFCGHNITNFDLRVIRQRATILRLEIPYQLPMNAKPWDKNPFDTMYQWDPKNFTSMDVLLNAMGWLDGKGDVDGSMVYDMWEKGQYDEIAEYCNDDVRKVRYIANIMGI